MEELARSAARFAGAPACPGRGPRLYISGPCQFAHLLIADNDEAWFRQPMALRKALRGLTKLRAAAVRSGRWWHAGWKIARTNSIGHMRTVPSSAVPGRPLTGQRAVAAVLRELDDDQQRRFQMVRSIFRAALEEPGQFNIWNIQRGYSMRQ